MYSETLKFGTQFNCIMPSHLYNKKKIVFILKFVICALRWTQNCAVLGYYAGNSGNFLRRE